MTTETRTTEARAWLDAHGWAEAAGDEWTNADGERMADLLYDEHVRTDRLWLCADDDPLDATVVDAYIWPDGSAIILTDGWWDTVDESPVARPARVLTEDEIDEVAREAAPWGVTLSRGAYHDASDDRADRWYWQRETDDAVDRRGRGHATIREAIRAAPDVLTEEYSRLVDELGGPTAVARRLGPVSRETVSRRASGHDSYRVGPEQVYALRYLAER